MSDVMKLVRNKGHRTRFRNQYFVQPYVQRVKIHNSWGVRYLIETLENENRVRSPIKRRPNLDCNITRRPY